VAVLASVFGNNGASGIAAQTSTNQGVPVIHVIGSSSVNNQGPALEAIGQSSILVGQSTLFPTASASPGTGNVASYGDNYTGGRSLPLAVGKN